MELSLAFITCKVKERYKALLIDPLNHTIEANNPHSPETPLFKSARLLSSGRAFPLDEKILPIASADSGDIDVSNPALKAIIWIGGAPVPNDVYVLQIADQATRAEILDLVLDLFDLYNTWVGKMRDMLLERAAIPDVVMLLSEVTDNPFWYGDSALRVRGMSDDRLLSQYSDKWDYQRKTGHYPVDVISNIVASGDLDRMNQPLRAWLFDDAESYTIPFVTKTIFLNGNVYGYLFIIELNPESCVCDLELAEMLGNHIATYVRHGNFAVSGTKRFVEQMLRACLAGNDVSDDERRELLSLLGWSQSPGFIVATFDRGADANDLSEVPQVQVELLRDSLGIGYVFAYDVYVIAIIETGTMNSSKIEQRIESTCRKLGWKAGVSDEFDNFSALEDHYGQAQIALQKGLKLAQDQDVFPYREFSLSYICQKIALEFERPLYMHPDVERLIAYDRENSSELVKTLASYLKNERNISRTAKELFLHRNSVIYRIDRIKTLVKTDIEDADNRLSLMISLKVWELS